MKRNYIVIFKAKIKHAGETFFETAQQIRQLALDKHHCIEFERIDSVEQDTHVSYWDNLDDIRLWKQDIQHLIAQRHGADQGYSYYEVEVCEILKNQAS